MKLLHNEQENFISPIAEVVYILWLVAWTFVLINKLLINIDSMYSTSLNSLSFISFHKDKYCNWSLLLASSHRQRNISGKNGKRGIPWEESQSAFKTHLIYFGGYFFSPSHKPMFPKLESFRYSVKILPFSILLVFVAFLQLIYLFCNLVF